MRVGVLVDTTSAVVTSPTGLTLVGTSSGQTLRTVPAGAPVTITADPQGRLQYVVAGATGTTTDSLLMARPNGAGTIEIGGKPYRGIALVRVAKPGRVTAINQVDMEPYLLGVVPREIGAIGDTLIEAAKAQAVAARTYAVIYMGRRAALGFDVFATVQDQVYGGVAAEHEPVSRAVRATAGEILTHQGKPIEAYYHSTCAGQTVAIEEAWPNEAPRPYLVAVRDVDPNTGQAYDRRSSRFQWTTRWDARQLEQILSRTLADSLRARGTSLGTLRDVRVQELTGSGRVRAVTISTTTGDYTVRGRELDIRSTLAPPQGGPYLNSNRFQLAVERNSAGELTSVVATGAGWGHGIGMCQVGAMGRATSGQDYRTILRAYFPATEIQDLY